MPGPAVLVANVAGKGATESLGFIIAAESGGVSTVFYDDDGHTKDFAKGVYARTEISVKEGERKVISFHRTGSYEQTLERLTLKVVSTGKSGLIVMAEDE